VNHGQQTAKDIVREIVEDILELVIEDAEGEN
jgi:hypothetical protein